MFGLLLIYSLASEKKVEIVLLNGVEEPPFHLKLDLNGEVIFSDTLYQGGVPYPRADLFRWLRKVGEKETILPFQNTIETTSILKQKTEK